MFDNLIGRKNFSLERLATLCHVAEAGSIGAATGDNPNKQSLYSRQIGELENFLGMDLLDRNSRPYRVTEGGAQLVTIARNYLSALDDFVATCQNKPSRLIIGAGESLIQWALIPKILPELRQKLEEVSVVFRNFRSEAIIEALKSGELDLGFVRKSAVPKGLETAGNFTLGYRLFVPKKFRVKLNEPVGFAEIAKLSLALLEGSGQFRRTVDQLAREAGVRLNLVTECSSATQVALLVARKECCAILPSFAKAQLDGTSTDDFGIEGFKQLERTLCFAWSPKRAGIRPIVEKAARICGEA